MMRAGLELRFKVVMSFFIAALVVSGLTAFPLLHEARLLADLVGVPPEADYQELSGMQRWIGYVRCGLEETYGKYPFLGYGTDWLAFAHIVIAVFFIGPLMRPSGQDWILISGMIACGLVVPLALICGAVRGIPFYWRLLDCSFGVLGIIPLLYCYRLSQRMKGAAGQ